MEEARQPSSQGTAAARVCDPSDESCPVASAWRVLGGKWKPQILWYLYQDGTKRFSELRRCVPGATEKMLTQHLRELEADGIVRREVYPQVPPKVEYSLTEHGSGFGPILEAMYDWGAAYNAGRCGCERGPC
jgi:DNA-binding HxlR family transcriptional regulator